MDPALAKSETACRGYHVAIMDNARGILTPVELRDQLRSINDDAVIGTAAVRRAATDMLSAMTQGQPSRLEAASKAMAAACAEAGH